MKQLRVMFVEDRFTYLEKTSIPVLAASVTQAGHQCALVEFGKNPSKAASEVASFDPDVLAYSTASVDVKRHLQINDFLRNGPAKSALSVFGGPHPTYSPEFIREEGVDAICIGEGDVSFVELLNKFDTDEMYETPNFSFKPNGSESVVKNNITGLVDDLDMLPFPDRDIMYDHAFILRNMPIRTFFAGRGCPYKCSYCFVHVFNEMYKGKGKILRLKSVDYLIREIKRVTGKYHTEFIRFHDDLFGLDQRWLREFAERYPKEIGLPFLCYLRPNVVTEKYAQLLKKAGCHSVSIAVECGNEQIRADILDRKVSDKRIIEAFESLKRSGIHINSLNMVGLPGETPDDLRKTVMINRKTHVDYADAGIFQPFPGLKITRYAKEKGYLTKGVASWNSTHEGSLLDFSEDFKNEIGLYHRLFALMVDRPSVDRFMPFLRWLNKRRTGRYLLEKFHRLYYAYFIQRRIFPARIPLKVRLYAAYSVLFTRRFRN